MTRKRTGPEGGWLALTLALSCSDPPKPGASVAELDGTLVARVGNEEIAAETVAAIAAAQGVDRERALELATFDALAAVESRARGLDGAHRRELNASLARALIDELAREARAEPPPSDEEIAQLSQAYWFDVDRPPAVVTVHAVVITPPDVDKETAARALALATRIREAVTPASATARAEPGPSYIARIGGGLPKDAASDDFQKRASAVATDGLQVVVQPLPALADDNMTFDERRQPFHPEYTRGAFKLIERGDVSEPVVSPAGVHVILLLARLPEARLSLPERRNFFEGQIVDQRVRARLDETLQRMRASTDVVTERSVDDVLEQVRVNP